MLNFRLTNYLFFVCLMVVNLMHFFTHVSGYWYIGLVVVYITVISIGSFRVNSDFHFHVTCKGENSINGIALTFDDGPDRDITAKVLDVLNSHNSKAVFFVIGKKAEAQPDLIRRIIAEGHVIGNHTYGHSDYYDFFSPSAMARDINRTNDVIFKICGISIAWFRPPYGVTNPMVKKALRLTKCFPVGWSIRGLDTVKKDPDKIIKRLSHVRSGDIVLLHDTRKEMPEILERFLTVVKEKGLKITEPEILIGMKAYNNN